MSPPVLYCHCAAARVLPDEHRQAALDALIGAGVDYEAVADLCRLAVTEPERLRAFAAREGGLVLACHPRAVRLLFARAGAELDPARVVDLRAGDAAAIRARLPDPPGGEPVKCPCGIARERTEVELACDDQPADAWPPWYPLVDRERCTDCRQCVDFCLFGVYAVDDENHVRVVEPANCKTNCPACARVCPRVAIVFPKHRDAPINGGEGEAETPVAVDVRAMMAKDPYAVLRARGEGRFGSQAGDAPCPCQLDDLGVPAEVLAENAEAIRERLEATRPADDEEDGTPAG